MLTRRAVELDVQAHTGVAMALEQGNGYLYFVYDDGAKFETHSVMVPRLNDLSIEQWRAEAEVFIAEKIQ